MSLKANSIFESYPDLEKKKIFLAISGGVDSVVLMHLLLDYHIKPTLLHCNYQLRGSESDGDEDFLRELAKSKGIEVLVKTFDTYAAADQRKLSIQETARELRYEWFNEIIEADGILLTAHHQNDNLETFFINLLRGTGHKGLTGIPAQRDKIMRPLLPFSREEILAYANENNIEWREDSSNQSDTYTRNKIRKALIPLLLELEPNLQKKFQSTLEDLKDSRALTEELITSWRMMNIASNQIDLEAIEHTNPYLLREALSVYNIRRTNFSEFQKFIGSTTGSIFKTKNYTFTKTQTHIVFEANSDTSFFTETIQKVPFEIEYKDQTIQLASSENTGVNKSIQQLDLDKIVFPITLRNHLEGDRIQPLGMRGSKLISRIFIDHKLNVFEKNEQLVIVDAKDVIHCLIGICISEQAKLDKSSVNVLEISTNTL